MEFESDFLSKNRVDISSSKMEEILNGVLLPLRYIGGENGSIIKNCADLYVAISFPDLYEIGMCNQAIRIIYELLNKNNKIYCQRLFAPDIDLKKALKENEVPFFTLESATIVKKLDILSFSLGTELAITTILGILDASGIPLLREERGEGEPIIICGGPAATNPLPLSDFIDAVFIGEFEEAGEQLFDELATSKKNGATRKELLDIIESKPFMWSYKKNIQENSRPTITRRAIWQNFENSRDFSKVPLTPYYCVQEHGVIEIMRGCPNNCRFCHAGIYYNPTREKSLSSIVEEATYLVEKAGYRELTLSSLSTGDYQNLFPLTTILNQKFENKRVTLSLPSLRVNTFALEILENLSSSSGRKSGLTFAIETPTEAGQRSLNKDINIDKIISILQEAKSRGWNVAKFYFMIGLPATIEEDEVSLIVNFMTKIKSIVKLNYHLNIGTFIPKAHTTYQWAKQLSINEAKARASAIKMALKKIGIKVNYHDPFLSYLEGIISRGDESLSPLLLEAYYSGCYLDPWEEHFKKELWENIISKVNPTIIKKLENGFEVSAPLPWDTITLGSSKAFFTKEYAASNEHKLTDICNENCNLHCGVCGHKNFIHRNPPLSMESDEVQRLIKEAKNYNQASNINKEMLAFKVLFSYQKTSRAKWINHKVLTHIMEKIVVRSILSLKYTEGFNPKPKIEFASPLPVGKIGLHEWCGVDIFISLKELEESSTKERILANLNSLSIDGLKFENCHFFPIRAGLKKIKLMPLVSASRYKILVDSHSGFTSSEFLTLKGFLVQNCNAEFVSDNQFVIDASTNLYKLLASVELLPKFQIIREKLYTKVGQRLTDFSSYFKEMEAQAKEFWEDKIYS